MLVKTSAILPGDIVDSTNNSRVISTESCGIHCVSVSFVKSLSNAIQCLSLYNGSL